MFGRWAERLPNWGVRALVGLVWFGFEVVITTFPWVELRAIATFSSSCERTGTKHKDLYHIFFPLGQTKWSPWGTTSIHLVTSSGYKTQDHAQLIENVSHRYGLPRVITNTMLWVQLDSERLVRYCLSDISCYLGHAPPLHKMNNISIKSSKLPKVRDVLPQQEAFSFKFSCIKEGIDNLQNVSISSSQNVTK